MANDLSTCYKENDFLKKLGNMQQVAGIKRYELLSGKASMIKAIDIWTGSGLEFTLLESKCLDLIFVKYKGVNFSFISKPGLVSDIYFNAYGNEFYRTFQAGMLYTCGLMNIGPGAVDGNDLQVTHGRIGQTAVDDLSLKSEWQSGKYLLEASCNIREAAIYNENLLLQRQVSTKLGSKSFEIIDTVINQDFEKQEFQFMYHFNIGYPILDKGLILDDTVYSSRAKK